MASKAVGYIRVSTEEQTQAGNGMNAQADAIQAHAAKHGLEISAVLKDEGISGAASLDKRPGLFEAIATLEKGGVLLVAKRDRLGRDAMVIAMVEAAVARKGARIVSTAGEGTENDDPTSVLMRRMVDAFAEYERLIIKARTKAALGAKKARGERVGAVPYGSRLAADGVHLERDEKEQAILACVRALRADGLTLREIGARLETAGYLARTGKSRWAPQTVKNILEGAA